MHQQNWRERQKNSRIWCGTLCGAMPSWSLISFNAVITRRDSVRVAVWGRERIKRDVFIELTANNCQVEWMMEWTGWQVEPSESVSDHPNFVNAACCRSKLKMLCWAVSKTRSVVGVGLLDMVRTCYGILWDSMRLWMSLNGIACMSMCMFLSAMRNPVDFQYAFG